VAVNCLNQLYLELEPLINFQGINKPVSKQNRNINVCSQGISRVIEYSIPWQYKELTKN